MTSTHQPYELLRPSQAAERLGISVHAIRRLAEDGHVPFLLVGTQRRFLRADLDAFVAAHRQVPDKYKLAAAG